MTSKPNDKFVPLFEQSGMCGGQGQISCEEANELIQDFLDMITDEERGALLQDHLGFCPPCESEFHVYQRIVDSLARCRPEIPPDTADRIKHYCANLCSGEDAGGVSDDVSAGGTVGRSGGVGRDFGRPDVSPALDLSHGQEPGVN